MTPLQHADHLRAIARETLDPADCDRADEATAAAIKYLQLAIDSPVNTSETSFTPKESRNERKRHGCRGSD